MSKDVRPEYGPEVGRLRIMHFAFEDRSQPESGGGSVRTHEINRRLAGRHDVTVVAAGWPGAEERVEDGVRYVHAGSGRTRARALSYFARLPLLARASKADLLVEDFAAPIASVGLPRYTTTPVIAVVQWLFARQMSMKYGLPFHLVENWGLGSHSRFVAVSRGLADEIHGRRPGARVDVVPNGVDPVAFEMTGDVRRFGHPDAPILFLGRLDMQQKGIDVLLEALALDGPGPTPGNSPGRTLQIAGDGPDERSARKLSSRLGLTDRIQWLGRVAGRTKFELLARAAVVVVPSRYETFGIVAAEALACGTPVIASNIACLSDTVPEQAGLLVPAEDPPALAAALRTLLRAPELAAGFAAAGRRFASRFDWDRLAADQERIYLAALAGRASQPVLAAQEGGLE